MACPRAAAVQHDASWLPDAWRLASAAARAAGNPCCTARLVSAPCRLVPACRLPGHLVHRTSWRDLPLQSGGACGAAGCCLLWRAGGGCCSTHACGSCLPWRTTCWPPCASLAADPTPATLFTLQVARGLGLDPGGAPKPRAPRRPLDPDRPRPVRPPKPPKPEGGAGGWGGCGLAAAIHGADAAVACRTFSFGMPRCRRCSQTRLAAVY